MIDTDMALGCCGCRRDRRLLLAREVAVQAVDVVVVLPFGWMDVWALLVYSQAQAQAQAQNRNRHSTAQAQCRCCRSKQLSRGSKCVSPNNATSMLARVQSRFLAAIPTFGMSIAWWRESRSVHTRFGRQQRSGLDLNLLYQVGQSSEMERDK